MTATMSDIARDLGVSVVTVSKALHNKGSISPATRKRVLKRAHELHYQVNWIARSLKMRRTCTIGLLLPDFTHPFFADIAKAVAAAARANGYHVVISYFEEDPDWERRETEFLVSRQVDGLIVASAQTRPDLFNRIVKRGIPLVLIDRPVPGANANFLGCSNEMIGRMATTHLIEQGCRRIAHLSGVHRGIAAARLAGFKATLEEHGIPFDPSYVITAGFRYKDGYEAMPRLLRLDPLPDGIFCFNDPVGAGAMRALFEHGIKVPQEIAVIGAGNVRYSELLSVPLSSIDQGTELLGREAAEILIAQISSGKNTQPSTVLIEPTLVVRQSTQRL